MTFLPAVGPAFFRSRMTWVTVLTTVIYVGLGRGFEITPLSEVLRVAQISLASVVIAAYWRNAVACYGVVGKWPDRDELIALGIVVSWISVLANGVWGLFWRLSGQPPWMVNNDWFNAWVALNCSAAFLHIKAPNVFGASVPRVDRAVLAGVFTGMVLTATIITLARPNLGPYAEMLRPLMEEPHEDLDLKGMDAIRGICLDIANGNLPP